MLPHPIMLHLLLHLSNTQGITQASKPVSFLKRIQAMARLAFLALAAVLLLQVTLFSVIRTSFKLINKSAASA
jgi:hypothetical protein